MCFHFHFSITQMPKCSAVWISASSWEGNDVFVFCCAGSILYHYGSFFFFFFFGSLAAGPTQIQFDTFTYLIVNTDLITRHPILT